MTFKNLKKELNTKEVLSINEIEKLIIKYNHISNNSKSMSYLKNNVLPTKIGNDKIGNDTLIINMSSCFNCYSFKMGYCSNNCYGRAIQGFRVNSMLFGLSAEVIWNRLSYKEILTQIEPIIINNDLKYIRFNEFGDFKNLEDFKKANKIAKKLKKYDVISYCYTNNKDLDIDLLNKSHIVVNFSYNTNKNVKETKVINKNDIKQYINNKNVIICNGNCFNCSYCKNIKDKRKIIFIRHGNGLSIKKQLIEMLTKKQYQNLIANKFIDYGLFLKNKP